MPSDEVVCLFEVKGEGGSRELWVGTTGGIGRLNLDDANGQWTALSDSTTPALPNNLVYSICEDSRHRIYVITQKGVARLTRRTPTPDDPAEFDIFTFTTEDGLPSADGFQNSSMVGAPLFVAR
jgi:hypothetical protein